MIMIALWSRLFLDFPLPNSKTFPLIIGCDFLPKLDSFNLKDLSTLLACKQDKPFLFLAKKQGNQNEIHAYTWLTWSLFLHTRRQRSIWCKSPHYFEWFLFLVIFRWLLLAGLLTPDLSSPPTPATIHKSSDLGRYHARTLLETSLKLLNLINTQLHLTFYFAMNLSHLYFYPSTALSFISLTLSSIHTFVFLDLIYVLPLRPISFKLLFFTFPTNLRQTTY